MLLYAGHQLGEAEWFADEVGGSRFQAPDDNLVVFDPGEDNHRCHDVGRPPLVEYLDAKQAGHELVEDGQVKWLIAAQLQCLLAVARDNNLVTRDFKRSHQECGDCLDIVCHENSFRVSFRQLNLSFRRLDDVCRIGVAVQVFCPGRRQSHRTGSPFHSRRATTCHTWKAMAAVPEHEMRRLEAMAPDHDALQALIRRRVSGEPLQYIEGSAQFGPVQLMVDERVLIPRPETETLYEISSRMVRMPEVIIDLCTGSGALALALKTRFPGASVFATEISPEALEVARENVARTGLRVYLAEGDVFDPLPAALLGEADLIVANPPYVAEKEFDELPEDVRREPRVALVSGRTGLEVIEKIGASAADWLRPGGVVVCEIGETQGVAAASSFAGLAMVVRTDLNGRDRYVVGVKP